MNFWLAQESNRFWPLLMALIVSFIAGCNLEDKMWLDKMISEMEAAWIEADNAHLGQAGREAAVTRVAQKYFRPGMKAEEAFVLLRKLKALGFEVSESRHECSRVWPDGEFKPYSGEYKITLQNSYPKGTSTFLAKKQYGRQWLIVTKHVFLTFRVVDGSGVISDVEGKLSLSAI